MSKSGKSHKKGVISQTASAERVENAKVSAVASKASALSDKHSDIRNTGYWACKAK
jgi:hypothetical protein